MNCRHTIRVSHPVQFATLPTPAMDNGDFSAYGVPIENPITGTIYSNGIIPQSRMVKILDLFEFNPSCGLNVLSGESI